MADFESDAESFRYFHEERDEYWPSEGDNESTDTFNDKVRDDMSRKRKAKPEIIKKNVRKETVRKGEEYFSCRGNVRKKGVKLSIIENGNNEIMDLNFDEVQESCTLTVPIEYAMNTMQRPHSSKLLDDKKNTDITNSAGILQDKNIGSTTDNISIKSNTSNRKNSKSGKTVALIPVGCLKYCEMKDGKFRVKINTLNKLQSQNSVYLYNPTAQDISNKDFISLPEKKEFSKCSDFVSTLHRIKPIITDKTFCNKDVMQSSIKTNTTDQSKVVISSLISTNTPNSTQKVKPTEISSYSFQSNMEETPKYSASNHHNSVNYKCESKNLLLNNRKRLPDNGNISTSIDLTEEKDSYVKADIKHTLTRLMSSQCSEKKFSKCSDYNSTSSNIKKSLIINETFCDEEIVQFSLKTNTRDQSKVVTINNSLISTNTPSISRNSISEKPTEINSPSFQSRMKEAQNYHSAHNAENYVIESQNNMLLKNKRRLADNGTINSNVDSTEEEDSYVMADINNTSSNSPFKVTIPSRYLQHCTKKNGKYVVNLKLLKRINEESLNELAVASNSSTLKTLYTKSKICNERNFRILCDHINSKKKINKLITYHPYRTDECRYFFMKGSDWDKFDPENSSYKGFNEREVNIARSCFKKFSMYLSSIRANYKNFQNDSFFTKCGTDIYNFENNESSSSSDLYFTNKIDILDKKGKKIRTERVYNDQTHFFDYQANFKKQKLEDDSKCMLSKVKPCSIVLERDDIVEEKIKRILEQQEIRKMLDTNFLTSTSLNKDVDRPLIILNEKNIEMVKLDEKFCTKCIVIFLKNYEDDFSESLYKNKLFIEMVKKNLIRITSPSVLRDYFREFF